MWPTLFALFSFLSLSHAAATTNRFIVEIIQDETPESAFNEIRHSFSNHPDAPTVATTITYNSPLFNGLSITIDTATSSFTYDSLAQHIRSLRRIERVYPVQRLSIARPVQHAALSPDQLFGPSAPPSAGNFAALGSGANVHELTGVARLHELGLRGAGATIAIIDTGADYLNPFLSGGIGPGYRITYGIDLVGDSIRPPKSATPDGDPYSECQPHGTHVAGIMGAVAPDLGLVGVVPDANLEIYRVFDCEAIADNDIIVDAVLKAAARGVDVINLSLGGGGPFEEDVISAVLSRVNNNGTSYCVATMGNNGQNGTFTAQAPGGGAAVPAVGSVDPVEYKLPGFVANYTTSGNDTENEFFWLPSDRTMFPPLLGLYVLSPNLSIQADACSPLPQQPLDLSNVLVLVGPSGCSPEQKMANIQAMGGRYVLIYNTQPGNYPFPVQRAVNGILGAAGMGLEDALSLIQAYTSTGGVQLTMSTTDYPTSAFVFPNPISPAKTSTFSSIGPPALGFLKPTLSGPGGQILSTFPRKDGYFEVLSGTSQAVPYISGVIALLKKARPNLSAQQITTILATTARPAGFSDGSNFSYPFLAPAWQQGGGLVSAYEAYRCQTLLDTEALSFNDTANFQRELSFTVQNIGDGPQDYKLTSIPAATVHSLRGNGNPNPIPFFLDERSPNPNPAFTMSLTPDYADIQFSPQAFSLAPGASQTVTVAADISQFAHLTPQCPLFSGWVSINGTQDALTLPWGAIGCSLYDLPVLDRNDPLIHLVAATNETKYNATLKDTYPLPRIEPNRVFVLPRDNSSEAQLGVIFPWLQFKFSMYTRFANIDLLNADGGKVATLLDVNTPKNQDRLSVDFQNFTGMLPSGEWADEGQYRFNLSAMRLYGNPNGTEDFQEWIVSDPFILQYQ